VISNHDLKTGGGILFLFLVSAYSSYRDIYLMHMSI
jgi:hypothetical protein